MIYAIQFGSHHTPVGNNRMVLRDYRPNPFVININDATKQNNTYRTAIWTGDYLQVTLMSLNPGEAIGLEMHPDVDHFYVLNKDRILLKLKEMYKIKMIRQS